MKSNLRYWLTANTKEAKKWRATAPVEELAAHLIQYKKRSNRMKSKTIDLAREGTQKIQEEAAQLARNDPRKLQTYIDDFAEAANERAADLAELNGKTAEWAEERRANLASEVEQLKDVLEILERARRY